MLFRRTLLGLTLLLGIFSLGACGGSDADVTIASKPMSEQYVLAQIIIELIEEETDLAVDYRSGMGGGTETIHPGMVNAEIDIYPEYTGTGWMQVLGEDLIRDPDELTEAVRDAYLDEFDIHWLERYGFNNTYGLAMLEEEAERLGIETYSDLEDHQDDLVFGAESDFFERQDAMPGLEETYGFTFDNTSEMEAGLKYDAVGDGQLDVISVWSTDGRLR